MPNEKHNVINFNAEVDVIKQYEEGNDWFVEGYAMTSDYDMQGDIITSEAMKSAEKDLLEYSTVLYNHDKNQPIGVVKETKTTDKGLWVKVLISKTVPDLWQKIKEGVLSKFSIRGEVLDSVKERVMQAGKEVWANIIKAMKLIEISVVSLPANPKARALSWYVSKALEDAEKNGTNWDRLVKIAEKVGMKISKKDNYSFEEVQKIFDELETKGILDLFGEYAPKSRLYCSSKQFSNFSDRKINESIKGSFIGKVVSLCSDGEEGYGASGTIEIESGEITEVNKSMADIKKEDGSLYTQEEINTLSKDLKESQQKLTETENAKKTAEEAKKSAEDAKVLAEKSAKEANEAKDKNADERVKTAETKASEAVSKASEAEKANKALADDNLKVKQENEQLKSKQKEAEINAQIQKKWDEELKGKAYEEKDAEVIKPILKKSLMGEVLTVEDTETLINKKMKGSILKIGFEEVGSGGEITAEKRDSLIKFAGIRVPKKKSEK